MKKIILLTCAFISLSIITSAQTKSSKEIKGDKRYFVYSYDKAIVAYTEAKGLSVDGQRKLAKSYCNMGQNVQAEAAYAKLVSSDGGNLPEDYFNYAMILKTTGKYEESNTWMDKFNEKSPSDLRAKDYVSHKDELPVYSKDEGKYIITKQSVNTDAEDFGTSFFKKQITFASSRTTKAMPKTANRTGKPFLNIYVCDVVDGQLKNPVDFDKNMNGKMNDGPASFNKAGTFMAYTQNNYDLKKRDMVVKLEIFFRTYADGKWSKPVAFPLNNKDYSNGDPCLTADGNTLYYSSDVSGGMGGVDIYKISKDAKGDWGKAENLGDKINTEGDELFPFYEEKSGTLFFASNGRFGLGGLDVFISKLQGTSFGVSMNAGAPLNTAYDDFALIVDDQMNKGYFSSNRADGGGGDDIYAVQLINIAVKTISGIAKDKDGLAIPRTFVSLCDEYGVALDTITTQNDGAYKFKADTDKNFKLRGKKASYLDGETAVNTIGKDLDVKADIVLLTKEETVQQKIVVGANLGDIVDMKTIYFDLDKSNIRPDAEIELAKIVKVMNENPNMVVELSAYTDCRASKEYNQVLSDKRAKTPAWYIKSRITKPERIYGKGYGETKILNGCECEGIVVSSCSKEDFQLDRRTEFLIVKK